MPSNTIIKNYCYTNIQINGNIISYGNSLIQAKNISMITIARIPPNKNWIVGLFFFIFAMLIFMSGDKQYASYGMAALFISIVWTVIVAIEEKNKGENLVINLNSGNSLFFYCRNREFLNTVLTILTSCMNQDLNKTKTDPITIHFDKCEITGGNFFNNSNIGSN